MPLRIAIVEDDTDYRLTLEDLISTNPGCLCVGSFSDGAAALLGIPALHPDVVIVDIRMPGLDGISCVAALKLATPSCEFVILTSFDDTDLIFGALTAGASGYLLKTADENELLAAIHQVVAGGVPMDSVVARKIIQTFRRSHPDPLSRREDEVLALLAKGLLYKEIASQLGVSYSTVNSHVKQIYRKLHVNTRLAAVKAWEAQQH